MRAISLWQPWATAIVLGRKTIETRSWFTPYRGPIAIHAAKRPLDVEELLLCSELGMPQTGHAFGAVVAIADLISCMRTEGLAPSIEDRAWGNFTPGRYGWVLANVRPLTPPVPARGMQGLWNWDGDAPEAEPAAERQLALPTRPDGGA
jgi:hypothetical protein